MAQALIKAVDHVHPDPEVDRQGSHKRGDIIAVRPNGHQWGSKEGPPRFVVVTVPDSWLDDDNEYQGPLQESRGEVVPRSARGLRRLARRIARKKERRVQRRHRWSVDLDNGGGLIDRRWQ